MQMRSPVTVSLGRVPSWELQSVLEVRRCSEQDAWHVTKARVRDLSLS